MIELNKKTQQDFLNREWVQKLLDAGVDMSDAKYRICRNYENEIDFVFNGIPISDSKYTWVWIIPTYTVSELINKLYAEEGIFAEFDEYSIPFIEHLASLLIKCHKKDIGLKTKDTGDISGK